MKLNLYAGFLGSGKTTLITGVARYLVEQKGEKVMIIVNDVGDIGIDAKLMKESETDVHELFGGCVCGQMSNLINLLKGASTNYMVDTILLEASGIAQPSNFLHTIELFLEEKSTLKVITLADATRWRELRQVVEQLVNDQVKCADVVLVNKIDKVDKETIDYVVADIDNLKPGVEVVTMSAFEDKQIHRVAEVIRHV